MYKKIKFIADKYQNISRCKLMDTATQMISISAQKKDELAIIPVVIEHYKPHSLNNKEFNDFIKELESIVEDIEAVSTKPIDISFINDFYIHSNLSKLFITRKCADSTVDSSLIKMIHQQTFADYQLKVIFKNL